MDFPFPVREVTEGAARLLVPVVPRRKGPGTAGPWPFFNPTMAVNRDLSAIVLARWPRPLRTALDGLAATGAWGIRMQLEAGVRQVAFNDRSAPCRDLIRANLDRNSLAGEILAENLVDLLRNRQSDFTDLDPFGSPSPFLGAALRWSSDLAGLGITATDTAALCGTYPETCQRRYGARSLRCAQGKEIGVRILLGYAARLAAARGRAIRPVISFAAEHFLRTIILVCDSRETEAPVGWVERSDVGSFARVEESPGAIGPIWTGPLADAELVGRLSPSPWTSAVSGRLLEALRREAGLPAFFVTTDELAARERGSPPKLERFLDGLRAIGFRATRTHFHPRGVKTDAPYAEVRRVFRERMPSGSTGG